MEAEDLLQATWLTAIERRDDYRGAGRLTGWLIGIMTNHARNAYRRRARSEAAAPPPGAPSADPLDELTRSEAIDTVEEAIAALPARYREVVALRSEGHESAEIARRLGEKRGTVRSATS